MPQFRKPDGSFTTDPSWAQHIAPVNVLDMWRGYSSTIPGPFIIGTVTHETDFIVNERSPHDQGDGTDSDGLTQLSRAEMIKAGMPLGDPFDAEDNLKAFAILMHRNQADLDSLIKGRPLPHPSDFWAFLSMSHNQGFGAVKATINKYGADYSGPGGYRDRNKGLKKTGFNGPAIIAYCDDVITGGKHWDPSWDALAPLVDGNVTDPLDVATGIGVGVAAAILIRKLLT